MRFETFDDYYKDHLLDRGYDVEIVFTSSALESELPVFMIYYITSDNKLMDLFVKRKEFLKLHNYFRRNEKLESIIYYGITSR